MITVTITLTPEQIAALQAASSSLRAARLCNYKPSRLSVYRHRRIPIKLFSWYQDRSSLRWTGSDWAAHFARQQQRIQELRVHMAEELRTMWEQLP